MKCKPHSLNCVSVCRQFSECCLCVIEQDVNEDVNEDGLIAQKVAARKEDTISFTIWRAVVTIVTMNTNAFHKAHTITIKAVGLIGVNSVDRCRPQSSVATINYGHNQLWPQQL